ncbi:DUF5684 domain-containing protein [Agromyces sp. MMS24-K17]|uniref:DUF5684 domain-containing protein n=1 Tax=Agromyces sp. MMS24-K17 TaxID=3372850 RepID=UPI00375444C3
MTDSTAAAIGLLYVLWIGLFGLIGVATYVATGFLLSKVFVVTGRPGWPAWVPILNSWRLLELGGQQGWLALLAFVPGANIVAVVFLIVAAHRIGQGFGKGGGFTALYVFLPLVWMALIGFGGAPWREPAPAGWVPQQPLPNAGLPAPVSGYPAPAAGFPAQAPGYPAQAEGFPAQAPGYPAPAAGLPAPATAFPGQPASAYPVQSAPPVAPVYAPAPAAPAPVEQAVPPVPLAPGFAPAQPPVAAPAQPPVAAPAPPAAPQGWAPPAPPQAP